MEGTIAEIRLFGGNFAPRNWAFCDGQLLAISSNSALFSILGTTYGGDGRTTFGLPDLKGRTAVGEGRGAGLPTVALGQKFGQSSVTLTTNNMPSHNHAPQLHAEAGLGDKSSPTGNMLALPALSGPVTDTNGNPVTVRPFRGPDPRDNKIMGSESITSSNVGGGQAFDQHQPSLGLNYIICLQGVFPSRN